MRELLHKGPGRMPGQDCRVYNHISPLSISQEEEEEEPHKENMADGLHHQ